MIGSEWERRRVLAADLLAKTMLEQAERARGLVSSDVEGIAKALANVEACERVIGRLCAWTDEGDGDDDVGASDCATRNDDENDCEDEED